MRPFQITRAGVAGTLLALAVAAACARLGVWQLDRLDQRRTRNAAVAERIAAAPTPLASIRSDTAGLLFRAVALEGEFDHDRTIIWRNRTFNGAPGVHVLTPLRLPGSHTAVLVDRGWLPAPDASTVDLASIEHPPLGRLAGLAIPLDDVDGGRAHPAPATDAPPGNGADRIVWTRLDRSGIARQLPYPIAPFYVQALPEPGAPDLPVRLPPPTLDEGPHLGYAIQWFGFAAVALIGCAIIALRRSGDPASPNPAPPLPDRDARQP